MYSVVRAQNDSFLNSRNGQPYMDVSKCGSPHINTVKWMLLTLRPAVIHVCISLLFCSNILCTLSYADMHVQSDISVVVQVYWALISLCDVIVNKITFILKPPFIVLLLFFFIC